MSSNEWQKTKIEDLVDKERGISYGIVQPGEFLKSGGVPILKVNNLTERKYNLEDVFKVSSDIESKYSRTRLKGNEILVTLVGSLGYVFRVTEKQIGWNVVRAIGVLPIKKELNRDFIYWALKQPEIQKAFDYFATHTVQSTLNLKELREIEISMPSEITQIRISTILTSLDSKIEYNLQTNQTLEEISRTIFKEWFVNFNYPNADGSRKHSEFGEIPSDWEVGTLGDIYKTTSGGTPSRAKMEYYENGTIGWIKSKELNNTFILDTEEKITIDALKNSSAKLLAKHSVLIAIAGATIGEVGITSNEFTCNQNVCAFLDNSQYPYSFIYHLLLSNKEDIIGRAIGSAQQYISQSTLNQYKLVIPPSELVKDFHKIVEPLFEKIKDNIAENVTLKELRDSLLPKLMSGEIVV